MTVARRTVTKYRKAMNIPSSRQRRDWSLGDGPLGDGPLGDETPGDETLGDETPGEGPPAAETQPADATARPTDNRAPGSEPAA